MEKYSRLFSNFKLKNLDLENRITMAPMYVGYANPDGSVNELVMEHYEKMGRSGAALIVVENAGIDRVGLGSPFMLRADRDDYIEGLGKLAEVIHKEGALAFLQINHAGRYAFVENRLAPSVVGLGETVAKEMTREEIEHTIEGYALAAQRVKKAGFDGVELHGGTGYLLAQFVSPRTNRRGDVYGGTLKNRMRFALDVVKAVRDEVGEDYPVGYRFLADELIEGGFGIDEAKIFAGELVRQTIDYLSVMVGTHESFSVKPYVDMEKNQGYMVPYAQIIKQAVPGTPVIAAGRIETPAYAEKILEDGMADLIGLARVLFADPLWPKKAKGIVKEPIVECNPSCSLCMDLVFKRKRPFCSRWSKGERTAFLERTGGKDREP